MEEFALPIWVCQTYNKVSYDNATKKVIRTPTPTQSLPPLHTSNIQALIRPIFTEEANLYFHNTSHRARYLAPPPRYVDTTLQEKIQAGLITMPTERYLDSLIVKLHTDHHFSLYKQLKSLPAVRRLLRKDETDQAIVTTTPSDQSILHDFHHQCTLCNLGMEELELHSAAAHVGSACADPIMSTRRTLLAVTLTHSLQSVGPFNWWLPQSSLSTSLNKLPHLPNHANALTLQQIMAS